MPGGPDTRRPAAAHFPDAGDPYTVLLARALGEAGWDVVPRPRLSAGWLWANRRRVGLLHFHWPSQSYETGRGAGLAPVRALLLARFLVLLGLARLLGYRLVWTAHNLFPHGPHRVLYGIERTVACRLLWHGVIAHCPDALEKVRGWFRFRGAGAVLAHPSFAGHFPPGKGRDAARAALDVPAGRHLFLCFGNIKPYKGIDTLVDACRILAEVRPEADWEVRIVGRGAPEVVAPLKRRAEGIGRLRWSDTWVPDKAVADYLNAADTLVLPYSRVTTSGNAMLAVTFRKPVVAPDLGCLPAMVPDGAGVIYPHAGGAAALAEAMARALTVDPERAARACERADAAWSWAMAGAGTAAFYGQLKGANSSGAGAGAPL